MIPLILKLKREKHKEISRAQDLIIEELYKIFDKAIIHGGTAIWRCYQGNRFSEDIDAYLEYNKDKIDIFFNNLTKIGFIILKKKVTDNSIYSNLQFNGVNVRFEAIFKKKESILKEYETYERNFIIVYTLTPEDLIEEKVNAYLNRYKIRDLYDIFFLLKHVKNKEKIKRSIENLIKNFKEPLDKQELKVLIIQGLIPDIKNMIKYIKSWI